MPPNPLLFPYQPQDAIPFGMLPQPDMGPPPDLYAEPTLEELQAPQQELPQDFWARLAQGSGPQPFSFQPGRKPTGLEVLLALASGIGNVKARQGAQRVSKVEQENAQARENARLLAQRRWALRDKAAAAAEARGNIALTAKLRNPPRPEPAENVIDPKTGEATKVPLSKSYGMKPAYPPAPPGATDRGNMGLMDKIMDNVRQDPDISGFIPIRDARGVAKQAKEQGDSAGDIVLMRMVAKATDPTTGVREEEFRTFRGAQGVLARMGIRLTTDMVGAGQLTPGGRQKLFNTVEGIYSRKKSQHEKAKTFYRNQAKQFGLDPKLVVRDFDEEEAPSNAVVKWGRDANGNPVRLQ